MLIILKVLWKSILKNYFAAKKSLHRLNMGFDKLCSVANKKKFLLINERN